MKARNAQSASSARDNDGQRWVAKREDFYGAAVGLAGFGGWVRGEQVRCGRPFEGHSRSVMAGKADKMRIALAVPRGFP